MGKIKVNEIEKHDATEVTVNSNVVMAAGTSVSSPSISTDTISEKTSASGVTVDGVLLKDNVVLTDTISEKTSTAGVTIDGVLIKDGQVDGVDVSAITSGSLVLLGSADASNSTNITFDNFVDNSTYVSYKLYIDEITPSVDAQPIYFIHRSSAPADITGTYYRSGYYISMYKPNGANSSFYTNIADTNFTRTATGVGTLANENLSCIIDIFPNNNDQLIKLINNNIYKNSDGHNYIALDASTLETATQMAGIKIQMQSGNIASGKFRLFGVKG